MNRRDFLRGLLGTAAATALAPYIPEIAKKYFVGIDYGIDGSTTISVLEKQGEKLVEYTSYYIPDGLIIESAFFGKEILRMQKKIELERTARQLFEQ